MKAQNNIPKKFPARGWEEVSKTGHDKPKIGDVLVLSDEWRLVFGPKDNLTASVSLYINPIYRRIKQP